MSRPGTYCVEHGRGPACTIRYPSEAAFRNETNATILKRYYEERQQRFRGSYAPPWLPTVPGWRDHNITSNLKLSDGTRLTVDQVAEGFELIMAPLAGQMKAAGSEGTVWDGVDTLVNPVDMATFTTLMWEHQPDLIIEIGTECGGSTLFFADTMRQYTSRGRVLTYDVNPQWRRCSKEFGGRRRWKAYKSPRWVSYVKDGTIIPRITDVTKPVELARVAALAATARVVWVLDDGDHNTVPLLVHFHLLARHVTPGGYYIVADTRLERTCSAARRVGYLTVYCDEILKRVGGPARAVAFLQNESGYFAEHYAVDRSAERWVFSQHPGGWLRRRCHDAPCPMAVPLPVQPAQTALRTNERVKPDGGLAFPPYAPPPPPSPGSPPPRARTKGSR